MESLTSTNVQFPAYDLSLSVAAEDVKKTSASLGQTEMSKVKLSTTTSYADHYPGKNLKFEKSLPAVHNDELKGPSGELDLSTINKSDYVNFKYGRPELNKISDNNVFGVSGKDRQSKTTTVREHYPGYKSEPAKPIRRGAKIEFGADSDYVTSYKTQYDGKSGGKLAAASFKDELELFSGKQDLSTIVRSDFKGHDRVEVSRHRPKDQIEIPNEKMSMDTVTLGHFPAPVVTAEHVATVNAAGKAALSGTRAVGAPNVKMSSDTSYKQQFDQKQITKVKQFSFEDELKGPSGELDLSTINKSDYVNFKYGRPELNKISDNNVFGVSGKDRQSKTTTVREHYPGFKAEPAKQIKAKENGIEFGSDDRAKTTVYGEDFKRTQPKVRKSKRRGTEVEFGVDFDHVTSYKTQFEGKSGGKLAAASFKDELELFSGKQDLSTIVRSDFKGHDRVEVSRHRPKDQIEIPNEKMSMDTVTLGHFPAPVVTAEHVATVNAAGKAALSSTKAFDISNAMMNVKMSSDTSYKQQYDKKKLTKVEKFSFADEIPASTGDIDLATLHKSDFTKYSYGRPQIHKTKDNNVFGINYDMGRSGLAVESLPPSRASLTVDVDKVAKFKSAPTKVKAKKDETSYGQHFKAESGKTRSSKKIDPSVTFGGNFYGHTSYADHFKTKKCLVPTLDELDEYTFKDIKSGHKVYSINCGCPPKGACGCTPPPIATVKVA
ncbi:hypothetical protein ACHWQZ_G013386 [Mnemiopsis leidyi]